MSDRRLQIAKQITAQLIEELGVPTVFIRPNKRKKVTLTSSKFGGIPYWDMSQPYPTNSNGEKLVLLAQFNLEDIKGCNLLPPVGILQFYVYSDSECHYGVDYENYVNNDCFRVIYHPVIDCNITEENIKELQIPTSLDNTPNDYDVIRGEIAVDFEVNKMASPDYGEFKKRFIELADKQGWKIDNQEDVILDYLIDDWDIMGEINEMCHKNNFHLLGYPLFIQYDPRDDEDRYAEYDTLLFQMESFDEERGTNFYAMWGDAGIAHFFINKEKLLKKDFSDIMYCWDCS